MCTCRPTSAGHNYIKLIDRFYKSTMACRLGVVYVTCKYVSLVLTGDGLLRDTDTATAH